LAKDAAGLSSVAPQERRMIARLAAAQAAIADAKK